MSGWVVTERERVHRAVLGAHLRAARLQADLPQSEVARQVGITQASLSNYEAGLRAPTAYVLAQLEHALGLPVGELHQAAWSGVDRSRPAEGRAA